MLSAPATSRWKTALPEDLRAEAHRALHALAHVLPGPGAMGPSLSGGDAGYGLFHAYFTLSGLDHHDHRSLAMGHLESAVDRLAQLASFPGLYSGYTGVAWTVDHLQTLGFLELEEDLNESIDTALLGFLADSPRPQLCELIQGLAGFGLYGLERRGRGRGPEIVDRIVDLLDQQAERQGDLTTWFNAPAALSSLALKSAPNGNYNLGLSHGVPGAVAFLAEAVGSGHARALPLLEGAFRWLAAQKRTYPNGSRYAYALEAGACPQQGTRLAWCYGDLGVAASLLLAARHTANPAWEAEALDVARSAALRPVEGAGAVDAALCHGAFGNAHIFNRLWQATGEDLFREAFLTWFREGLRMRRPGEGLAGYLTWHPLQEGEPERSPWTADPGLLEGGAGIALALLAALSPQEPHWDRFLLVHLPPASAE